MASMLVYAALFLVVGSASFRTWLQTEMSRRTGLEVRFAELSLRPPLQIVAGKAAASRPGEFHVESARLRVTLTPVDLWSGTVQGLHAEQLVLTVDLGGVAKSSEPTARAAGLRHLKLEDATIILKNAGATVFELENINLAARNLDIGQRSGLNLRADVPSLNAEAELHFAGTPAALSGELVLRPKNRAKAVFTGARTDPMEWLRLHAQVKSSPDGTAHAKILGAFKNLPVGAGQISGDLDARATIDHQWKEIPFAAQLTTPSFLQALGAAGLKIADGSAAIEIAGSFSLLGKTLEIRSATVNSPLGRGMAHATASLAGDAALRSAKIVWRDLPLASLQALLPPAFAPWKIEGHTQITAEARGPWNALRVNGAAQGDNINLRHIEVSAADVNFFLPFTWSKQGARVDNGKIAAARLAYSGKNGWRISAERAEATASVDLAQRASLKIAGTVQAAGGKFSSPDGRQIGENLTLRGPLEIAGSGNDAPRITTELTAESGEILWDKFFTDLKAAKPRIQFEGAYVGLDDRLECRRGSLMLENIGMIEIAGSIDRLMGAPRFELQARSAKLLPGGFFDLLLRDNLKRRYPFLDTLVVGGATAFQAHVRGSGADLALTGELALSGGELRNRSGRWELSDIALKLPFTIGWGNNKETGNEKRAGSLAIGKIRFAGRDVRLSPATFTLFQNELRFVVPLRAAAFGGEIVVGDLRWPDLAQLPRQLSFSLAANRLQLEEFTEAVGWPRFAGTLTGTIPEVQSTGATVKTNGEIRAEVFGGRVGISKLEIHNPFSGLASIRLDAALANIDLERLSRTFAFGRISGILEGTVADLTIIDGQPAHFAAALHSVDRGGEQRISVEALDKITVLSSGQSSGALYGGLAGLFDSFRYSKLGLRATLRNDRLVLRGVETRGDQEYLVVGSLIPPTVNVVSHTQSIAFSELVRRLERIRTEQPKVQ